MFSTLILCTIKLPCQHHWLKHMYRLSPLLCLGLSVDDDFATHDDTSEDLAQYQATEQQGKQPLPHFLVWCLCPILHALGSVQLCLRFLIELHSLLVVQISSYAYLYPFAWVTCSYQLACLGVDCGISHIMQMFSWYSLINWRYAMWV